MAKSIMTQLMGVCYICGQAATEVHHIYGGNPGRKNSDRLGLTVPLCHWCHNEPPLGVHHNREQDLALKRAGEAVFKIKYPELDFVEIFGRSYIGIEDTETNEVADHERTE